MCAYLSLSLHVYICVYIHIYIYIYRLWGLGSATHTPLRRGRKLDVLNARLCVREHLYVSGFRPCRVLAESVCLSGRSDETFSPISLLPSPSSSLHMFAHFFGHCADDCRGGAGVCLFLECGSQIQEVYRCCFYLGDRCAPTTAEFEACRCALLIVLSFMSWLANSGLVH